MSYYVQAKNTLCFYTGQIESTFMVDLIWPV